MKISSIESASDLVIFAFKPLIPLFTAIRDTISLPTSKTWGERFDAAVEWNWPRVIHKAVAAGISPERNHSVYNAVDNGSKGALKALIALGVNINADKDSFHCPLRRAARSGDEKTIEILLAAKANPNSIYDQESPLLIAVRNGHTPIVGQLIKAGADIILTYTHYGRHHQIDAMAVARQLGYIDIERMLAEEQKKRGTVPAPAPQAQPAAAPSAVPALVAEIEKLSDEDRSSLFNSLGRKFSDDLANAGKIKVGKPLQFTRKPEPPAQST